VQKNKYYTVEDCKYVIAMKVVPGIWEEPFLNVEKKSNRTLLRVFHLKK